MGYRFYQDPAAPERFAGYGVPALCDWPDCSRAIDRGLSYKCESHNTYDDGDELVELDGCGRFFCPEHEWDTDRHAGIPPKADTLEWIAHQLTDDSWKPWRTEHPDRVDAMRAQVERGDA